MFMVLVQFIFQIVWRKVLKPQAWKTEACKLARQIEIVLIINLMHQ